MTMTPQQALEVLKQQRSIMPDNHQTAQALNIAIEVMEKHINPKDAISTALEWWDSLSMQQKVEYSKGNQFDLNYQDIYILHKNLDKPDEVEAPYVIPNHTIPIESIEEIIISTAPAPAKLNQITNLIEKYK